MKKTSIARGARAHRPRQSKRNAHRGNAHKVRPTNFEAIIAKFLDAPAEALDQVIAELEPLAREDKQFFADLALAFFERQQHDIATALGRRAIRDTPDSLGLLLILARSAIRMGDEHSALPLLERASKVAPGDPTVLSSIAGAKLATLEPAEAIRASREAAEHERTNAALISNYLLYLNYHPGLDPEWIAAEHKRMAERLEALVLGGSATQAAATALDARARSGADRVHGPSEPPQPPMVDSRKRKERLRLGFVSADFRVHAVAMFFMPVLRALKDLEVEVCLYSNVKNPDHVTERCSSLADRWRDVTRLGSEKAASLIRRDAPHVLIDLAGHSGDGRLDIFIRRPAPLQATWIGYPNTTGLSCFDFRIVDQVTDPPGADRLASERLLRLERCFLAFEKLDTAPVASPACERNGIITFGSFNNFSKLNDLTLDLWCRVLEAVPNSRLLLKSSTRRDSRTSSIILERIAALGHDPARVTVLERSRTIAEQLARYNEIDIALDTTPYSGTTTTCEALWMGVPVITLAGSSHASRVSASLLTAVRFDAGITTSPDDFVLTAAQLASAPPLIGALRKLLRIHMVEGPLCDAPALARELVTRLEQELAQKTSGSCITAS